MTIENKKQWKALLTKARRGNSDTQWEVGHYYEEGLTDNSGMAIVKPQPLRALYWYTLSAKNGNDTAQDALSTLLSSGDYIKRDMRSAIYWSKQAISQGNSSAAHNLGTIYRDLKKLSLAFYYYNQAVEMGDMDSMLQVGLCYLFGIGTKRDHDAAYKCIQKIIEDNTSYLCERTKEDAFYWMGIFHLLGIGGAKISVTKSRIFLEAANKDCDHEQANEILNILGKTKYIIS